MVFNLRAIDADFTTITPKAVKRNNIISPNISLFEDIIIPNITIKTPKNDVGLNIEKIKINNNTNIVTAITKFSMSAFAF